MDEEHFHKLTHGAVARFGDPELAQEYLDWARRRAAVTDELGRRVDKLEHRIETFQSQLAQIASDNQTARVEMMGALKSIGDQVAKIGREQLVESGRKIERDAAAARAEKAAESRGAWARAFLPFVVGAVSFMGITALAQLVRSVMAAGP